MERPRRRKAAHHAPSVSAEYYLGYVEDNETPEMIQKKFEAMEEYLKTIRPTNSDTEPKETEQEPTENSEPVEKDVDTESTASTNTPTDHQNELTQDQAADIFRMTSYFSIEDTFRDEGRDQAFFYVHANGVQDFLDFQTWSSDEDAWDSASETSDFDEEEFWGESQRKRKRGRGVGAGPQSRGVNQEILEYIPFSGLLHLRKRHREVNKYECVYTRIPEPLPRSWARVISPYSTFLASQSKPHNSAFYTYVEEENILEMKLSSYGGGEFVGILMDPPWQLPGTPLKPNHITPAQLGKLKITEALIPQGIIFIWVEKELIPEVVEVMEKKWNFFYCENLVWIKNYVNNRAEISEYSYFKRSKLSLLFFIKKKTGTPFELRHQRNPDVIWDYLKIRPDQREEKPEFVYNVIETLLPTGEYNPETGHGKFLELWGRKGVTRKGWTTIVQK